MSEGTPVDLWRALADELKLPLVQIARTAELAQPEMAGRELRTIETAADNALRLIDGYLLVSALGQQQLALSPVSVSAMLYDVAQDLHQLGKLYDTDIEITVKGSPRQAMAHAMALRAALTSLAYTLVTGGLKGKKQAITLTVRQTSQGIMAGVFSNQTQLVTEDLQLARNLYGKAHQPASGITQNSGVGLYIADNLCAAMESPLKVVKVGRKTGLVTTLLPSQQLALL
jgi:light-regulated signal transduction histidine kinase (bacteriophytochrome)